MKSKDIVVLVFLFLIFTGLFAIWILTSSTKPSSSATGATSLSEQALKGKKISEIYCNRCHNYPEPKLLDKKTWVDQTLPNMGPRLGILSYSYHSKPYPKEHTPNLPQNVYPDTQLISTKQWQDIVAYYKQAAPQKLSPHKRKKIKTDNLFFDVKAPSYRANTPPLVTAIRLDPVNQRIYFSDASRKNFYVFDKQLQFEDRFSIPSPISDIRFANKLTHPGKRTLLTSYIGSLNPSDAPRGFLQPIWYNLQNGNNGTKPVIIDSLKRPVSSQFTDLDQDGKKDLLVNEFGHRTGSLFWLKNKGHYTFSKKKTLIHIPGCIESHVADLTNDGLPDVVALCSQLTEAIFLFPNKGNGKFGQQKLLQFEVVSGSSSFKLVDFNHDGHLDILYTSGDNADYSTILKPYHGVYIYLNDGHNQFSKKWFYPMHGAYDAVARDFDKDGHLDIASIAFFADYEHKPQEGFIYFKNHGNFSFTPYHPPATSNGRWLTMDVADWTGNGRDDIVIANFSMGLRDVKSQTQKKFTEGPHFMLLENKSK